MHRSRWLSLSATFAISALAAASLGRSARGDVVTTTEGLVLEGTVERGADGSVTVKTEAGVVRLAPKSVKSVEVGEGPRAALLRQASALAPTDVDGWYRLAVRSEASGLPDLATRGYEAVIAADPDHAAARRALAYEKSDGAWISTSEARRKSGLVLYEGAWVLPEEIAARIAPKAAPGSSGSSGSSGSGGSSSERAVKIEDVAAVMRTAAVGEPALAHAAELRLLSASTAARSDAALAMLYDRDAPVRVWACARLASLGDESALRPLLVSAERDKDPDVRRAAITAAAAFGNDDIAIPFIRALGSTHPGIVVNAARALAILGDVRAIGYVVKHIVSHGPSARAYVAFLNKVSYIRDYDVEIAQAANIANPIIGQVVDGIVLDAKVIDLSIEKTIVETVLYDTFNALAGTDIHDEAGVLAWVRANAGSLRDFPEKPEPRRVSKGVPHAPVPASAPAK